MTVRDEASYIVRKKKIRYKKCSLCGYNLYPIQQLHHIKPVSCGGDNSEDNLMIVCPNCHYAVHRGYIKLHADNFNEDGGLKLVHVGKEDI